MTRNRLVRSLIVFLIAFVFALLTVSYALQPIPPKPNNNALAIGNDAAAEATVTVGLNAPADLNFKSKAQVFDLRQQAVRRYPALIKGDYTPADAVFGQIQDGKPWWGMVSLWYYDATTSHGEKSILGPADQSRYLLNPYLLAAADVYTYTVDQKDWRWDTGKFTEAQAGQGAVPLIAPPTTLQWQPAQRRADVTYHIGQYLTAISPYVVNPLRSDIALVDLTAYNARDLNLNYLYVSLTDSVNVQHDPYPAEPYENPQYIHTGPSCGYPGGCNNRSPTTPILDDFKLTPLPASLTIYFWQAKPPSVRAKPDFTFVMHFD